ncbi:hypothetical protein [Cryptosporangium sp. NPDC051539]|uniref:hypothetical protein n=1 Tax=Cryptosporangium sp. NPDC051539 TaxID=3363962 RepID=UPI0037BC0ADC
MAAGDTVLGIDFGTSSTIAMLRTPEGRVRPLLFDASPLLASGVYAGTHRELLTGVDAEWAALAHPGGLELNPKRRIGILGSPDCHVDGPATPSRRRQNQV